MLCRLTPMGRPSIQSNSSCMAALLARPTASWQLIDSRLAHICGHFVSSNKRTCVPFAPARTFVSIIICPVWGSTLEKQNLPRKWSLFAECVWYGCSVAVTLPDSTSVSDAGTLPAKISIANIALISLFIPPSFSVSLWLPKQLCVYQAGARLPTR